MKCPHCEKNFKGLVLETRQDGESVYRKRFCPHCSKPVISKETFSVDFRLPPRKRATPRRMAEATQISRDIFKRWY